MTRLPLPHSSAQAQPRHAIPPLACDAHIHILDKRVDARTSNAAHAPVENYQQLQSLLGTQRAVVIQPRPYGTDHRVTLDAIARLGLANARGVGVIHPDITDQALSQLHDGGIRGVRMSLYVPEHAAVSFDMLEALAHRVHALGWHLQMHWTAEQIVERAPRLLRLPVTYVFDHLARLPVSHGTRHPAYAVVRELLQRGQAWVKLSCAYLNTALPAGQGYADVHDIARAWVTLAPDRVVWGSDWPHVTEHHHKPDDSALLDLLHDWTGDAALFKRVLVDNPARLYGFDS